MDPDKMGISESEQVICKVCGLTARNKDEMEEHINHAHKQENSNSDDEISAEQKIDPFIKTK
ncbi:MAG: hypothetical protein ACTHKK_12390 [Candidatus Nitrosocosmicus sp.]